MKMNQVEIFYFLYSKDYLNNLETYIAAVSNRDYDFKLWYYTGVTPLIYERQLETNVSTFSFRALIAPSKLPLAGSLKI